MRKLLPVISVLILLLLWLPSGASADTKRTPPTQEDEATSQNPEAAAVFMALADAINRGDVEQIAALHAEDAVFVALPPPPDSNGVSIGREEIHADWAAGVERHMTVEFTDFRVYDNKVTWTAAITEDIFRYIGAYPILFRAVGVVQDGQIQSMTLIMHKESIAQLEAAGHKTIARRVIEEAWNQGALATVDELFAADTVYHDPDHADSKGVDAVKELITAYRTAFPDLQLTITHQLVEGDLVATHWQATGTHQGEYQGIAPTGKTVTLTGMTLQRIAAVGRVEERQIVESWNYWDGLGLLEQLGVGPTATK